MPELPEVETVRRDLEKYLVGKEIVGVEVKDSKVSAGVDLAKELIGRSILRCDRRGKLLMLSIGSDRWLLIHLKMTGQLIFKSKTVHIGGGHSLNSVDDKANRFNRVMIKFADGSTLAFNDMRKFGYMKVVKEEEKKRIETESFGIEPMTRGYTIEGFKKAIGKKKTSVKAWLLDQKSIAGVGNIYADEACFMAGILPWRLLSSLSTKEIDDLFKAVESVVVTAVENRGTTFKNFIDGNGEEGYNADFLKVFDQTGEPCKVCSTPILKIRHAGRGTHYCEVCQK
jgi:formamidopyrimidine-DNA glycosylase